MTPIDQEENLAPLDNMKESAVKLLCARWVLPISTPVIERGAVAVRGAVIESVGSAAALREQFPDALVEDFGGAAILPGLVNAHSHLELTAMRGFLDAEDGDFRAWLIKLTRARTERMSDDDLAGSIAWGALEAIRAGVTTLGDASSNGYATGRVLREAGLRATLFQESFGPDPQSASENVIALQEMLSTLRKETTPLVTIGVSPHAPYTVSAPQLKLIAELAGAENYPVMMHVAESADELLLMRDGRGAFGEGLRARGIDWTPAGVSTVQYLDRLDFLRTKPLLAHCITVDRRDIETIKSSGSRVAHCPKSNAKFGHGVAPLASFVETDLPVGLGSDSVASNNLCDMFEEARFALLQSRTRQRRATDIVMLDAEIALRLLTLGGARALGIEELTGSLEAGKQADLAVVSLDGVHQQPVYDPASALVFASHANDVVLTMVAGHELFRAGHCLTLDEADLRHRLTEIKVKLSA